MEWAETQPPNGNDYGCCLPRPRCFVPASGLAFTCRRGVFASTPFIGAARNNFSHIFLESFLPRLSRSDSTCLTFVHLVSRFATFAVRFCSSRLSSFESAASASLAVLNGTAVCFRRSLRGVGHRKKRRQEDNFLPPPVLDATVFALCQKPRV